VGGGGWIVVLKSERRKCMGALGQVIGHSGLKPGLN